MINETITNAIKETGLPYHRIAWEAGLTPNQLYKITAGIDRPGPDDPRISKLCAYLKISTKEIFNEEKSHE